MYSVEVNCKDLRELFDMQGPNSDSKALQETMGVFSTWLMDVPQYPLVRLIQSFGQFIKNPTDAWR